MAFTYDLSDNIGKIRMLIFDTDSGSYVFEDAELSAFYDMETSIKRAAALALETMASNEAFTLKVISLMDLRTDGAATARALLARAALLREQADDEEFATDGSFEVVEWVVDDFSARERLRKQQQRLG